MQVEAEQMEAIQAKFLNHEVRNEIIRDVVVHV